MPSSRLSAPTTILLAGVVGALLIDLYLVVTMAWIFHTASVRELFLWDASNLLGTTAFQRGIGTVLLGCFLHLVVSLTWAVFFVLVLARIPTVARHPVVCGILAGVGVKFFMQYVIVPLGHANIPHHDWISLTNNLLAHTFFFGVPVLWIARRANVATG
jgi:hypothetical protein